MASLPGDDPTALTSEAPRAPRRAETRTAELRTVRSVALLLTGVPPPARAGGLRNPEAPVRRKRSPWPTGAPRNRVAGVRWTGAPPRSETPHSREPRWYPPLLRLPPPSPRRHRSRAGPARVLPPADGCRSREPRPWTHRPKRC